MAKEQEEQVVMSKSDFIEAMRTLATELRKPDEATEKRMADEAMRRAKYKKQVEDAELLAHQQQEAFKASCSHKKENGKYSTGGQIMADGKALLICFQCSKNWRFEVNDQTRRLIDAGDVTLAEMRPPNNEVVEYELKGAVA